MKSPIKHLQQLDKKLLRQSAAIFSKRCKLKSQWNKFSQGCLLTSHHTRRKNVSFHRFPYITWSKSHACFHSLNIFTFPLAYLNNPEDFPESFEWDGSVHDLKSLLARKCFVFVIFSLLLGSNNKRIYCTLIEREINRRLLRLLLLSLRVWVGSSEIV